MVKEYRKYSEAQRDFPKSGRGSFTPGKNKGFFKMAG